jgi:hypothetical protein
MYQKPQIVVLKGAIEAVQGTCKDCQNPEIHGLVTTGSYEADE